MFKLVCYLCLILTKTETFCQMLEKIRNTEFHKKLSGVSQGLHFLGLAEELLAGCCECHSEYLVSIRSRVFLGHLDDY